MGRAKAWLPWFGRTMIEHVVSCLSQAVDEIVVVTSASLELPPVAAFGARVVTDREPERGPLAGIRDGIASLESDSEFVFVTSTDAPFLTDFYVSGLLDRERACAPISDGFVQVLSAVYPRGAAATAEKLLGKGVGRPLRLLEAYDFEQIELPKENRPAAWHGFNTPEAYLTAVRDVEPEAMAEIEFEATRGPGEEALIRNVPVGTLSEVLAHCPESASWEGAGGVPGKFQLVVEGGEILREWTVPIGPSERVRVIAPPTEIWTNEAHD
jgi:molybdopterin-guanine dinucleotide biosynthesis protein A